MTVSLPSPVGQLAITPRTTPRDLFAKMNKTERAFAIDLEAKRRNGFLHEWHYEAVTFKLGHDCRYTPDFMVIENDGTVIFHETKGHMRDDALVKLRTFAKQYPFPIFLWRLSKGVFTPTPMSPLPRASAQETR